MSNGDTKLYKLEVLGDVGSDCYDSKIVRAMDSQRARRIANKNVANEGPIWTEPDKVSCHQVKCEGPEGVILQSFNAG